MSRRSREIISAWKAPHPWPIVLPADQSPHASALPFHPPSRPLRPAAARGEGDRVGVAVVMS